MHAAHLVGIPAVVLWGPTKHEVYGYPEHTHVQLPRLCSRDQEDCIGAGKNKGGTIYGTPCPLGDRQCMNQITPEEVYAVVKRALFKN